LPIFAEPEIPVWRGNHRVLADLHVNARCDQVIEFRAAADDRMADRCTVDRAKSAISTSSSIITFPICGIFEKFPFASGSNIRAIETDHRAGADDHIFSESPYRHK